MNRITISKGFIYNSVSFLLNLGCLAFVIYQTTKCIQKFIRGPKSTDVSMQEASLYPYPAITMCYKDPGPIYNETLQKCNLSWDDYYNNAKFIGVGTEDFCQYPAKLYSIMTGNSSSLISRFSHLDDIDVLGNAYFIHEFISTENYYGKCYTHEVPKNVLLKYLQIEFSQNAKVYFHEPGGFYDLDMDTIEVNLNESISLNVRHNIFEVLDFNSKPCAKYENGRDSCVKNAIFKVKLLDQSMIFNFNLYFL